MLRTILKYLGLLIVVVVAIAYILPGSVKVQRETVIDAAPGEVFALVNSFENFNQWSPWYEKDPDGDYQIEGPEQGVGARMTWASEATVASTRAQLKGARRTLEADAELSEDGLISRIELEKDRDLVEELEILYEIEQKRLGLLDQVDESRIDAQEAKVGRLEALAAFRREQLDSLRVVASVTGVLQELPLEDGQWIEPGALIAKVVRPDLLKAEIKVPQNQARELLVGQTANIDVRTGFVPGVVVRIDPSVQDGAVVVDVELKGELPRGARPDMTVEGLIELDRLPDAIYVSRPALAQADSEGTLFLRCARTTHSRRGCRSGSAGPPRARSRSWKDWPPATGSC